jgi:uncharacterized SAM-binding protein YcdF (DUF218 family)
VNGGYKTTVRRPSQSIRDTMNLLSNFLEAVVVIFFFVVIAVFIIVVIVIVIVVGFIEVVQVVQSPFLSCCRIPVVSFILVVGESTPQGAISVETNPTYYSFC